MVVGQKAPTSDGDNVAFVDFSKKSTNNVPSGNFKIIPQFKGDVPAEMQASIQAACDVWESLISAPNPITIDFIYCDSLYQDNIVESRLEYEIVNNTVYPYTLISAYGKDYVSLLKGDADGEIKINNAVEWDCTLEASVSDKPNLCFYALRALAQTFGFSTSLCKKSLRGKSFSGFFIARRYSAFDKLVLDSTGKRLSSIVTSGSRESAELNAFVCPPAGTNVYVLKQDDAHKLYAPTPFIYGQSLALLDNPASLMHYNPGIGSKQFAVDDVTIEVLKGIGWQFEDITPSPIISITSLEVNPEGEFCAYEPHAFTATADDGAAIENMTWTYELPDTEGVYHEIKRESGTSAFTIPALASANQYSHNADGFIEGHILLSATVNGRNVNARCDVLLSITPKIVSAEVTDVTRSADGRGYSLTIRVDHVGADYLRVYLEEEYNSGVRSQMVSQPNAVEVIFDNVTSGVYIWIDIKAINEYGEDLYTIELDDEFITKNVK